MQQDQVLDRLEGVAPLAVRSEDFFHKVKIFEGEAKLLRAGGQKIQFIGRMSLRLSVAED